MEKTIPKKIYVSADYEWYDVQIPGTVPFISYALIDGCIIRPVDTLVRIPDNDPSGDTEQKIFMQRLDLYRIAEIAKMYDGCEHNPSLVNAMRRIRDISGIALYNLSGENQLSNAVA